MGVWDDYQDPQQARAPQPAQAPAQHGGGGVGAFLYNTFVKPTVDSTLRGGQALTQLQNTGKINNPKQFLADTVQTGTSFLPVGKAAAGIKGLAKVGAGVGAAQNAANSFAQGGDGGQIADAALGGAATGAVAGGVLGGAGKVLSKVVGRGGPSVALPGNPANKLAASQGAVDAQAAKAGESATFNKLTPTDRTGLVSHDKSGQAIGPAGVRSQVRGLGLPADTAGLENYSNIALDKLGNHLNDMLGDVKVDTGSPADIGRSQIMSDSHLLGNLKAKNGAAATALNHIRDATSNLGTKAGVPDVLQSISSLRGAASDLQKAADNGDLAAKGQQNAYKAVVSHLEQTLNNHPDVNSTIADFKFPSESANLLRQEVAGRGGSPALGQHIVDTLNNAKTYGEVRSAMQPAMIAKNTAKLERVAEQATGDKAPTGMTANDLTPYEAMQATHSPAGAAVVLAKMAGGVKSLAGKGAAKLSPDAYKTGFNAEYRGASTPETAPIVPPPASPTLPGKAMGLIGSLAGQNGARNLASGEATLPTPATSPDTGTQTASTEPDLGGLGKGTTTSSSSANDNMYSRANMMSDVQRDPKNAATYLALYKELNPAQASPTGKVTAQQVGLTQSGLQSLQALKDEIAKNPGIVNQTAVPGQNAPVVGGLVRNLAGTGDYQAHAGNVLDSLAHLRTGAAMSNAERQSYIRLLPTAGDSPETVQTKLAQLEQSFAPFIPAASN